MYIFHNITNIHEQCKVIKFVNIKARSDSELMVIIYSFSDNNIRKLKKLNEKLGKEELLFGIRDIITLHSVTDTFQSEFIVFTGLN